MKVRGAAVQGTLALGALVAAWATWQRGPDRSYEGDIVALDFRKTDIERIRYEDSKRKVELFKRTENGETVTWLRDEEKPAAPKPAESSADGGAQTAAAPAETPTPRPARELKGGDLADKAWERFAPMRASRALGALSAEKLKELGFGTNDKHVEIVARGTTKRLTVATVSGLGSTYVRDDADGKVWLLKGMAMADIENAGTRLADRRLHVFKTDEFDALTVSAGGKTQEYTLAQGKLAPKGSPDKPDEFARNWSDKVWRLFATETLGRGETPAGGEPKVEARIDYASGGKAIGFAELARTEKDLYLRTEHTSGWVKLSTSSEALFKEALRVSGAEKQ